MCSGTNPLKPVGMHQTLDTTRQAVRRIRRKGGVMIKNDMVVVLPLPNPLLPDGQTETGKTRQGYLQRAFHTQSTYFSKVKAKETDGQTDRIDWKGVVVVSYEQQRTQRLL